MQVRSMKLEDAPAVARIRIDSWRHAYKEIIPKSVLDSLNIQESIGKWKEGIQNFPDWTRLVVDALRL